MGLFDLTDLVVQRAMQGASLEQQVLSNNLSNANTPGFKRADVNFESALASAVSSSDPQSALDDVSFAPQTDAATAMTADGNNVDLERENSGVITSPSGEVVLAAGNPNFSDMLGQAQAGVRVDGIVSDPTPGRQVYDPTNPDADAKGYVTMPNVSTVTEMTNLITESRSYEADTQALDAAKQLYLKTLDILR